LLTFNLPSFISCLINGNINNNNINNIIYDDNQMSQVDLNDSISSKAEALSWADGLLMIYSITDRDSFNFIKKVKQELQNNDMPVLLIGEQRQRQASRQAGSASDSNDKVSLSTYACFFHSSSSFHSWLLIGN